MVVLIVFTIAITIFYLWSSSTNIAHTVVINGHFLPAIFTFDHFCSWFSPSGIQHDVWGREKNDILRPSCNNDNNNNERNARGVKVKSFRSHVRTAANVRDFWNFPFVREKFPSGFGSIPDDRKYGYFVFARLGGTAVVVFAETYWKEKQKRS